MSIQKLFARFANQTARLAGRPVAFAMCCLIILVWGVTGPIFGYSDTWQLVINTGTTIVTFLMVFLIQNTQNRDGAAIQAKLDELIRASRARNAFIGIEHLTEDELETIRRDIEAIAIGHGDQEAVPHLRRTFKHAVHHARLRDAASETPPR